MTTEARPPLRRYSLRAARPRNDRSRTARAASRATVSRCRAFSEELWA